MDFGPGMNAQKLKADLWESQSSPVRELTPINNVKFWRAIEVLIPASCLAACFSLLFIIYIELIPWSVCIEVLQEVYSALVLSAEGMPYLVGMLMLLLSSTCKTERVMNVLAKLLAE